MDPELEGAVAEIVKAAVPVLAPGASPALNVTEQVSVAPAVEGKEPQLTLLTPVPAVTAVATTPAGNLSFTVALVVEVVPPEFPRPNVYVMDPLVLTEEVAVLLSVRF